MTTSSYIFGCAGHLVVENQPNRIEGLPKKEDVPYLIKVCLGYLKKI